MKTFKQFIIESKGTKLDEQQIYNTIYSQLSQKLGSTPIPQDITRYGVTADLRGLTLLMMKVANKESGFYNAVKGDAGYFSKPAAGGGAIPGGSHGLFQLSPVDAQTYHFLGFKGNGDVIANTNGIRAFSLEQLYDPTFNINLTTSIWADSIKKYGSVGNRITKNYGWVADREMGKLARYDGTNLKADGGNVGLLAGGSSMPQSQTSPDGNNQLAANTPPSDVIDMGDGKQDFTSSWAIGKAVMGALNNLSDYAKYVRIN